MLNLCEAHRLQGPRPQVLSRLAHTAVERKDVNEGSSEPSLPSADGVDKQEEGLPFGFLKGKVSEGTLKAITVRPMKLTHMTPVQETVLSLLPGIARPPQEQEDGENGSPRDLLVRAKTGTGKTLAFLVPAIEARLHALEEEGERAVRDSGVKSNEQAKEVKAKAIQSMAKTKVGALILSPTRELATQIANEAIRLTEHQRGFEVQLLTGGISKGLQMRSWNRGRLDIVVATTGRLRDLMDSEPEAVRDALKSTQIVGTSLSILS